MSEYHDDMHDFDSRQSLLVYDIIAGRAVMLVMISVNLESGLTELIEDAQRAPATEPGDTTAGEDFCDDAWYDSARTSMCVGVRKLA